MKALVTGTGRCGTQWAANVLALVGVKSTHERVFNERVGAGDEPVLYDWDVDVDCSWMAVAQRSWWVPSLLVVREPAACIRSLYGARFAWGEGDEKFSRVIARTMPWVFEHHNPVDRLLAYYVHWNLNAIARATWVTTFDEFTTNPYWIGVLAKAAGAYDLSVIDAQAAMKTAARNEHVGTQEHEQFFEWAEDANGRLMAAAFNVYNDIKTGFDAELWEWQ